MKNGYHFLWRKIKKLTSTTTLLLIFFCISCERQEENKVSSACVDPQEIVDGIVIGDSIAEGRGDLFGRFRGQCENKSGQISFSLENYFNTKVLNHGIGGHTCKQVVDRWTKHVDAYNPQFVWLNCGHNDLVHESNPINAIKTNTLKMIQLSRDQGYRLYIQNMAYSYGHPELDAKIDEINFWLSQLNSSDVTVIDFHSWATSNQNLIPDGLHPSSQGYESFMNWVISNNMI